MKIAKILGVILLVAFVGIQFVPTDRNEGDIVLQSDFMTVYNAPQQIATKIKVSCYDCHSNNTKYPWYNKIQPIAWFLAYHIDEGKSELDFSIYGEYSKRRQKSKLKSIVSQIRDDEMPLSSYTLFHKETKLSENDKTMLLDWLNEVRDNLNKK